MKYLNKYNEIMSKYKKGEFGSENLSLHDILEQAKSPNLIDNMSLSEIWCLYSSAFGVTKNIFYMLWQKTKDKIDDMKKLEEELKGYNIGDNKTSYEVLAGNFHLSVEPCDKKDLPDDTEAMLCPSESKDILGVIKILKGCLTRFPFIHELIHYIRDVGVGNKVTEEYARKIQGKTPNNDEQKINYLTAASIMPIKEITAKLDEFENIISYDEEKKFLSTLAEQYAQDYEAVFRRFIEVRRLVDYENNPKL